MSEDAGLNLERTEALIRTCARDGARIICLQELFGARYFPQEPKKDFSHLAEPIPGETTRKMCALARELEVALIVPLYEKGEDGNLYNSAAVADADGKILGTYRKIHVPYDECFYEKEYFADGNLGFRVFQTRFAKIGVLICYDQWIPEAARSTALLGADIIFYPTAIGWVDGVESTEGDWHDAWETVQRGHAIANGVHVAAANRVGREGRIRFWGGSFVCDAFGTVLGRAGEGDEAMTVQVDLDMNREVREGWGFMRNRRPGEYGALTEPVVEAGKK